jgi:hypothetical protein
MRRGGWLHRGLEAHDLPTQQCFKIALAYGYSGHGGVLLAV